jgi:NADH:ubiquinone oxidoreductase subunit 6 (subunit J)
MDWQPILFYVLAALTGLSAIAVVVTQNIVRAATFLLFALGGTAGIFFLLGADFVGAAQLLIYVGGTLVLVVFGVMLTAQGPFISMKTGAAEWAIATVVGLALFGVLATVCVVGFPPPAARTVPPRTATDLNSSVVLGEAFLGVKQATPEQPLTGMGQQAPRLPRTRMAYLLPFEIISVHLLVVLVGAAYLARAKRRKGAAT